MIPTRTQIISLLMIFFGSIGGLVFTNPTEWSLRLGIFVAVAWTGVAGLVFGGRAPRR